MRELEKVVNVVVRKRSKLACLHGARHRRHHRPKTACSKRVFNRALELDALIVTKLDGTAKGGIALAVSHELKLPIIKIGVGEGSTTCAISTTRAISRALSSAISTSASTRMRLALPGENAKEAAMGAGERRRDVIEGTPARRAGRANLPMTYVPGRGVGGFPRR